MTPPQVPPDPLLPPRWTVPAREWIPETEGWREHDLHLTGDELADLIETAEMYHTIHGRTYLLRPADLANAKRDP